MQAYARRSAVDLSVLRGGFSTEIHLLTDWQGLPLGTVLSAGQRHESVFFTDLTDEVSVPRPRGRPRKRPEAAQVDRAYGADWIRQRCADKGIESAIPARKDLQDVPVRPPTLGERRYRDRNTVERCVGHLKERRRLVVRYEKKAGHSRATASSHDPLGVRPGIPEQIIIRRSLALTAGIFFVDLLNAAV
ncbi:transposase [Salinibacter ruber]|uniref:transposase n=1 Tax=Salinibacter ruber TaxID=146919 RepID=UPI003C6DF336